MSSQGCVLVCLKYFPGFQASIEEPPTAHGMNPITASGLTFAV